MNIDGITKPKPPGAGKALLLMVGLGLIGALLGCLVLYAWPSLGRFTNPFRALPALPEPAARVVGATVNSVTVEASTGQLYEVDIRAETPAWQAVETARNESDEPCESFAANAPPLSGVVERRIACQNLADAGVTTVFVLREDGRVWYWTRFDSAYMALAAMLFAPLCGGGLGLLAGLVIFLVLRRRKASAA